MKKIIKIILPLILLLSACLVGCDGNGVPIAGSMLPVEGEYGTRIVNQEVLTEQDIGSGSFIRENYSDMFISYAKEDKLTVETNNLLLINDNIDSIFPGSLLYVEDSSIRSFPYSNKAKFPNITLTLKAADGRLERQTVRDVSKESINNSINELFERTTKRGAISPSTEYKMKPIYASGQLQVDFGMNIEGFDDFDYPSVDEDNQYFGFEVTKRYYSVATPLLKSSDIFDSEYEANVKDKVALATNLEYGKKVFITMKCIGHTNDCETLMNQYINESGISTSREAENFFSDVDFRVYELNNKNHYMEVPGIRSYEQVVEYINNFDSYSDINELQLLGYSANSMNDLKCIKLVRSVDYHKFIKAKNSSFYARIDYPGGYTVKNDFLYGRKIVSINSDGTFNLGNWEKLYEMRATSNNGSVIIDGNYVSFGYSFDIVWGTDFPYSGVFYTADDISGLVKDIFIELGGTDRNAWIKITVNNEVVFEDRNCSSHEEYKFK